MITTATAFLVFLFSGLFCLLAGVGLTRFYWRKDIPPYGRHTRSLHVALHPEDYVKDAPIRVIRCINLIGAILIASAAGVTIYEVVRAMVQR
jgi:hypothetical protein